MEVDDAGAVGALEMAVSTAPASSAQPPKADTTASAATRRSPRRRGPKEKVEAEDEEDDKEDLAAVVNWVAMMTTEAAEVAAATAAADGRPAATYSAACWLLRLREACMHQPTLYHEVVQALHLRRSRQLSTEDATARVTKLVVS